MSPITPISPIGPIGPLTKVCGMRDAENIREVEALGINLMGFIFWPHSSRYVSAPPPTCPQSAAESASLSMPLSMTSAST